MIARMIGSVRTAVLAGVLAGMAVPVVGAPRTQRINLVDFGRVVEFVGDWPETPEVRELKRGSDGWEVWEGADGEAMIGVEWEEPRDIVEAQIEFRHAIAERHLFRVQYLSGEWPTSAPRGSKGEEDPLGALWMMPPWEWWAGDRDISFAFKSLREERRDEKVPDVLVRRTFRLRFLCGKRDEELPPVRYLRAYGPSPAVDETFDIRFDAGSTMPPPLLASVMNGYVVGADGKTTLDTARIGGDPGEIRVRFAEGEIDTPNRTIVTLKTVREPIGEISFVPADVVKRGLVRIADKGITISHRGTKIDPQTGRGAEPKKAEPKD